MVSKYDIDFDINVVECNISRLTNQIWKLIPMRENNEDWQTQMQKVLIELTGFNELFKFDSNYITLLSNLEGLLLMDVEFIIYRSKIFESISLLRESFKNAKFNK